MNSIIRIISVCLLIHLATAPPPRRGEPADKKHDNPQEKEDIDDFGLEYNRYLKEVIDLLESDPEFKRKLEDAQEVDIRSGQIARELDFVDHKVRTKLDEVKRQEIERLRHLAQKQYELSNGIETEHVKISSEHLDHENPHTFEMEDLKKLIAKVSADLNEADEKRRQEFKEYEMQKEFEKQQKLKHLEGSEKEAFEKQLKENETKHKQHEPLHHPGSKQQLEEVWEKQDHMENQEFDPKVFFELHDLDGNGFWDHNEVKTLFLKELDKMYEAGAPEDDMKERMEEMERMREHVFNEADKNRDGLISYDEFINKTKQPDFDKDYGWESLDQKPAFTQEEYHEFEKRREEEIQRMIQQGLIPPQPVFHQGQGYHPQLQYSQYHAPQYQAYPGVHSYPSQGQPQYRYAQEYPNPPPNQGYHGQPLGGHSSQPNQAYSHQSGVNQNYQSHQVYQQQVQSQQNQQHQVYQSQAHPSQSQGYQQPQAHSSQPQGYQQHQAHLSQSQNYQQPQAHPNQPQGYQQPQAHLSQSQNYQQPQAHPNQPQGYEQPQAHLSQSQNYQQPQAHPSQSQGYQQPQAHSSQPQGYQQPQVHPSQSQGYQQPQVHPSQSQGYQQPQVHPSQSQGYQQPQANHNQHSQGYKQPPQQNQAPQVQNHQNQPSHSYQGGHDPNEILPVNPQQHNIKYSKDSGNSHPNVIDLQHKKVEGN